MKKFVLLLIFNALVLGSTSSFAGTDDDDVSTPVVAPTPKQACKPVKNSEPDCPAPALQEAVKEVAKRASSDEGSNDRDGGRCEAVAQPSVRASSISACNDFFCRSPGEPCGAFGQFVYNSIRDHFDHSSSFFRPTSDMYAVCPNFNSFSDTQKINFWVYVMAGVAAGELDCSKSEKAAHIVNGLGVGPFQMELEHSRRAWRGGFCKAESVRNWKANTLCALTILNDQLVPGGRYGGNGALLQRNHGYWEVLRPGGNRYSLTSQVIAHVPGCGDQTVPSGGGSGKSHHRKKNKKKK